MIQTHILYLLKDGHRRGILLPDENGVPTFPEQIPFATSASYVQLDRVHENDFVAAQAEISQKRVLLVFQESPDGPPRRCARCFTFSETKTRVSWQERTQHHSATMDVYEVTTTRGDWSWRGDHSSGKSGYFLTGANPESALWRIERIEGDALDHSVFTLAPVRLIGGLVPVDFTAIADTLAVSELMGQYADLARSIEQHAFRDVVTKARNIIEVIIAYRLELLESDERLSTGLKKIRKMLEDPATRDNCGWTQLQYHISHKIRLLHGQTHATTRTALRPELALSTIEDLNFLLREWGYCQPQQK